MTRQELIASLDPGYWSWIQDKPNAMQKLDSIIAQARSAGWGSAKFNTNVQALKSYSTWSSGQTVDDTGDAPPEDELPTDEFGNDVSGFNFGTLPEDPSAKQALLGALTQFLTDNQLPASLISFIQDGIAQDKPYSQIIAELRQTPEYKQAYPENPLRLAAGLDWMAESEVRAYRSEARRITQLYLGVNPSNDEIGQLMVRNTSLSEWEHRLQVNQTVKRWGGAVQSVFEDITGQALSEERLHAFFDPQINTERLDQLYARALERGQPAALGFGVRPDEEAALLEQYGLDPNQIFQNYQKVGAELPRFERLAKIGGYLERNGQDFFGDVSVAGTLLFRAVQLGDPTALAELQRRTSEEAARFQAEGGAVRSGRALVGLQAQ